MSLRPIGMPCNGPRYLPAAISASAARASRHASSPRTRMKLLSRPSSRAMRSSRLSASSTGDNSRFSMSNAASSSALVISVSSTNSGTGSPHPNPPPQAGEGVSPNPPSLAGEGGARAARRGRVGAIPVKLFQSIGPLRFPERRAGLGEAAQQRRGRPTLAIALMPGGNLVVDLAHPDCVGPVHQPATIARKAEAVEPHHIDVAGAQGFAFVEDPARLVDAGEEEALQDLVVGELALRHTDLGRGLL